VIPAAHAASPCHVEHPDVVLGDEAEQFLRWSVVCGGQVQPGLAEFLGGIGRELGTAGEVSGHREDDCAVRIPHVPLGALGIARRRRFLELVVLRQQAVLGFSTPSGHQPPCGWSWKIARSRPARSGHWEN